MARTVQAISRSPLIWFAVSCVAYVVAVAFVAHTWPLNMWPANLGIELKGLLSNILASFLLFYLVAYLPERRRQASLKRTTQSSYRSIKRQLLYDIVWGSIHGGRTDLESNSESIDQLMEPKEFRKAFDRGSEADEGFYAFSNFIQTHEHEFKEVIFKFRLVGRQIEFLLNNVSIDDDEMLGRLKRIEQYLYSLDLLNAKAGYNEEKQLSKLIWEIFAGWSFINGYRERDPIEEAIDLI